MKNLWGGKGEEGVFLGDRSERLAEVDDSNRRLSIGFVCFIAVMTGVVQLGIVVRSVTGQGPQYSVLRTVLAAVGVCVSAHAVRLVVRTRKSGTWRPLVIAFSSCIAWVFLGAALARIRFP